MNSIGGTPGPANDTSTLVLAANRTKRPDILSGFRKYRGGWDIANKHYWALFVLQSGYTVQTLRNVTEYLSLAKNISVSQNFLPSDVMEDIDRLNLNLDNAADTLEVKTNDHSTKIRKVFNTVRWALITVAAVMLFVSILGLVLSIFRYQHMIQIFIVFGWLFIGITFVLCSISVILDNTISDICMAMGEWEENPHAETALSNVLPCVDETTTSNLDKKSVARRTGASIYIY